MIRLSVHLKNKKSKAIESSTNKFIQEIFSQEIFSILKKKIFARSKYFFSKKNPPKNLLNLKPISKTSRLSNYGQFIFCLLVLTIYFMNLLKFPAKCKEKELSLVYSLTKDQAIRKGSIKPLHDFMVSKGLRLNSNSVLLVEVKKLMRAKKYNSAATTLDIPLWIYANTFSVGLKIRCCITMFKRFFNLLTLQKYYSEVSFILKEYIFDEIVYSVVNTKKIRLLITTQSHIAYQPLIFEYKNLNAKKIMIWYFLIQFLSITKM